MKKTRPNTYALSLSFLKTRTCNVILKAEPLLPFPAFSLLPKNPKNKGNPVPSLPYSSSSDCRTQSQNNGK